MRRADEAPPGIAGGALEGCVVLDLTRFLSGPYCTLLLAGLGAEVIKIDDPASGDPTVGAPPFAGPGGVAFDRRHRDDLGLAYLKRARGKRSTTLNLKHPEGRELFLRLVERADVVVDNFRPGVAERLGIGHAVLEARNPGVVTCTITGYGATGPDRQHKSYDLMAQAASGLMSITGTPDGPPTKIATAFSDMLAGTYAALGIVSALHERARSGRGQAVDVSMVECLFSMMMDEPLDCYEQLGVSLRQGNRIMRFSPFNAFPASDGWVVIGVATDADWRRLLGALGREDLLEHEDFARVSWRIVNNDAVDAIVGAWTAARSVAEVVGALEAADVACSAVRTPGEAIAWPHLRERGMVRALETPAGEPAGAVAAELPLRFSRSQAGHDRPAPIPGADTAQVLERLLGIDAETLAALRRDGVV